MITESPVLTSEKSTTFVTIVGLHRIEKFFPSVNRTLKERYPSSCQCEIQSTFLPCTSGYRRRSLSYFFLISPAEHRRLERQIKEKYEKPGRRYPEVHGEEVEWISHWHEEGYLSFNVRFTDVKNVA